MGSQTAAGTSLAISATGPATNDAAGFAALTFVDIGQVEKLGTFGASFAKSEFQPLKGAKQKYKGSADNGAIQPSIAIDTADAGQTLLQTAAEDESQKLYSFCVTFPDGAKRYFRGRVFGSPETADGADSMLMATPTIEISTKVVKLAAGAAIPPPTPPTLTMTQLTANRIYQRSTTTGGAASKGAGAVDVPITLDSAASTIEYRLRDAGSGNVVQDWTTAASNVAASATKVTCPNVPARLGWVFLDLRANGGAAQMGTNRIGVGRLVGLSGQSQAVRKIGKMPDMTETNASLNVVIDPNTSVYARYTDSSRTVSTPAWAPPADSSNYDSTFLAEFLRLQVASFGVNCGIVAHAVGETTIASWAPGQQNFTDLAAVLDAVGGFEAFGEHIGGTDAGSGTSASAYSTSLTAFFNGLPARNAARGNNFERYICAMATRLAAGAGSAASVQAIRKAAQDTAAAIGATYLEPHDVELFDNVHQGQPGSRTTARHWHRATQIATDNGPTLTSGTRSGTAITLTASAALNLVGAPVNRFSVFNGGTSSGALAIASMSVSGATITLNLSADPGSGQALDVYWLRHPDPSKAAGADMLFDTYAADGLPTGRHLAATTSGPIAVAAPTPTPSPTPSANLTDTFTAADGTAVSSRNADTGQAWSFNTADWKVQSNRAFPTTAGAEIVSAFVPASANYFVSADFVFVTSLTNQGIYLEGRCDGVLSNSTAYFFGYRQATGGWIIGKTVAGTFTVLANVAYVPTAGDAKNVRGEMNGSALRLLVDGVQVLTATDSSITAMGKAASRATLASTATTGCHFDNLNAGALT